MNNKTKNHLVMTSQQVWHYCILGPHPFLKWKTKIQLFGNLQIHYKLRKLLDMRIAYTASVLWTGYKCMHIWFKIAKSNLYLVNRNQLAYALLPALSLHFQIWLYPKVLWSIFFCVTNSGLWVGWNKLPKEWEVMVHPGQVTYI